MASTLNLASLKTPGVYIDEVALFPPSVAQVETAIPAFIGYTEIATERIANDLLNRPKRITSLKDYERFFGFAPKEGASITVTIAQTTGDTPETNVRAEMNEATRSAHVLYYAMQMFYANGGGVCYVVSVGGFGGAIALGTSTTTGLRRGLEEISKVDEPTLLVFPEATSLGNGDLASLNNDALMQCATLKDRFVVMDVAVATDETATDAAADFRTNRVGSNNLKYGAAYTPFLQTNIDFNYNEATVALAFTINGAAQAAVTLNELTDKSLQSKATLAIVNLINLLPPSAAVVGIYAAVDTARGVWKAPANVSLNNTLAPTYRINDQEQEGLNIEPGGKSINAIRAFSGKGTLIWGARTLAGSDNEWKYIPVRRFFNMVEESIKKASAQFVFEPNDANTWVKVRAMIENFLTLQWRAGALAGAKPEHAFFVRVGLGQTMTAEDVLNGFMIVEIGMAVVRPAEFIVLRFSHKMQES